MTADDMVLVREYARSNSEETFAALVERHVNLVYSVALRRVADAHLAEEITQAVFIILARKANALGPKTIVPGWLCRTARYVSANALTTQRRRQRREQEAQMQSLLNEPESADWNEIAPLLEDALARLDKNDHDALVLRFFQNKSLGEVGMALGIKEDTARMRISRALEKLRKFFAKRGIASTTAIIAGVISTNSVQAAPAALAKSVTAVAVAKGAAASVSTLTLAKGALKVMAWTKAKTAIVAGVVLLLTAGTATVLTKKHAEAGVFMPVQAPWSDAGAATPKDALETLAWALTSGKMDRAEQLMQWEETNTNYDNAPLIEHQLALGNVLFAVQGIASFKILSVTSTGPEEVRVKFRKTFKQSNIMPFAVTARLERVDHEWRVVGRIDYYPNGVSTLLPFSGSF